MMKIILFISRIEPGEVFAEPGEHPAIELGHLPHRHLIPTRVKPVQVAEQEPEGVSDLAIRVHQRLDNVRRKRDVRSVVLVSHQPPYGVAVDRIGNGLNVGSRSIRDFIEDAKPLVCFSGHIHEGQGIDNIGTTKLANPGPLAGGGYVYSRIERQVEEFEIRAIGNNK